MRRPGSTEWVATWAEGAYHAGERHLLAVPTQWDRTSERWLVIRTRGGSASTVFTDEEFLHHWASAGYPVLSCDLGSPNGAAGLYGGDTVVATAGRIKEAWAWAKANVAIFDDKFILDGGSRGGVDALNYLIRHPADVLACTLSIPVCDAEDVRANDRSGQQAAIEAAYGGNAGWQAARPTRNPVEIADDVAASGVRLKVWSSTNDPVCLPAFTAAFVAASGCEHQSLGAVGHSQAGQDFTQMHEFVGRFT